MINKLNSITPLLQQDWSLPCEPNAVPTLQNWLEKLSANIQSTDTNTATTIYPNVLTNQIPPTVLLSSSSSSRSPSPSTNDYDLYPKLSWSHTNAESLNISPLLIQKQHYTTSASESSAVHTPPPPPPSHGDYEEEEGDTIKPQFWSPSYIHSYSHDEILEKSPLFKQDTLSPSLAIDFSYNMPPSSSISEKATYFETCLTQSNPVVPSLDSSSNMSFVDKKEIVNLMNVFSSSESIKYKTQDKATTEKEEKVISHSSSSSVASSVIELPSDDEPQMIKYPTIQDDTPALNLYPAACEEEQDESEYCTEEEEETKSPYADLVELVEKLKLTKEEPTVKQRHITLVNELLRATSRVV